MNLNIDAEESTLLEAVAREWPVKTMLAGEDLVFGDQRWRCN
jgi:hypothetical protein